MKFPTYKELGKQVAKEALDTFEYNGKTLREWIEIISATEFGTDLVSRQAAIDKITKRLFETAFNNVGIKQNIDETLVDVAENRLENWFNELPSVQPYVIRCKDCKWFGDIGCAIRIVDDSDKPTENDFCSFAERRE